MKNWFKIIPAFVVFTGFTQYNPPANNAPTETQPEVNNRWNDPRLEEDLIVTKLNILDYVAPAPKLSADVEFRPAQGRIAYQAGAGLLPNFSMLMSSLNIFDGGGGKLFKNSLGGMVRGEFKFYLKESKVTYISAGIELDYRFLKAETTLGYEPVQTADPVDFGAFDFLFDDNTTEYAYFQNRDMNMHRFSSSWGFNIGQARVFRNRFSFEWFVGTRMNVSRVYLVDELPADAEIARVENSLGWRMNTDRISLRPSFTTGVRFGWGFKKKSGL